MIIFREGHESQISSNSIRKLFVKISHRARFTFHSLSVAFSSSSSEAAVSIRATVEEERLCSRSWKSNVLRTRRGKIVEHKSCADWIHVIKRKSRKKNKKQVKRIIVRDLIESDWVLSAFRARVIKHKEDKMMRLFLGLLVLTVASSRIGECLKFFFAPTN